MIMTALSDSFLESQLYSGPPGFFHRLFLIRLLSEWDNRDSSQPPRRRSAWLLSILCIFWAKQIQLKISRRSFLPETLGSANFPLNEDSPYWHQTGGCLESSVIRTALGSMVLSSRCHQHFHFAAIKRSNLNFHKSMLKNTFPFSHSS